jgi:hypothetical protein
VDWSKRSTPTPPPKKKRKKEISAKWIKNFVDASKSRQEVKIIYFHVQIRYVELIPYSEFYVGYAVLPKAEKVKMDFLVPTEKPQAIPSSTNSHILLLSRHQLCKSYTLLYILMQIQR